MKKPDVPVILCGHSMGGAIAIRVAHDCEAKLAGLIIIDVVEGTAIDALPFMDNILASRPKHFDSMEAAI
jgi:protein phosphatase methylesterase 1